MKQCIKKFNTWLNQPMSLTICYGLLFTGLFLYIVEQLLTSVYDSDMYFLIASGREILEEGIIHNNVWIIDSSSNIVIQQWLYAVLLYVFSRWNYWGFLLFLSLQIVVFFVLLWQFFSVRQIPVGLRLIMMGFAAVFGNIYLFTLRPELITIILLLAECVVLEQYSVDGKIWRLCFLPVLTLLEINLHASMWIVHFLIILAYLVPTGIACLKSFITNNDLHKNCWALLLFSCLSFDVLFINPYGLDSVLYMFESFRAGTFSYITVREMLKPDLLSVYSVTILLALVVLIICAKYKKLSSVTANITCGFVALACYAVRNNMFMILVFMFLFRDLCLILMQVGRQVNWQKYVQNYCYFVFGGVVVLMIWLCCVNFSMIHDKSIDDMAPAWNEIYAEIQKDYNPDMHVFTGFNCGGFFEYKGMKNLYMDARPELYTKLFTKDKHLLRNYTIYCTYGCDVMSGKPITKSDMDSWFDSYDFDYVIVHYRTEVALNTYLMQRQDYVLDKNIKHDNDFCLFKRIAN